MIVGFIIAISFESCNTKDDMAPVITLIGSEALEHPLNETYVDAGATALDETDGDLTSSIFVDNAVDVDYFGDYYVTYTCVDKAGNEAIPVSRKIRVINSSWQKAGNYAAMETQVFPMKDTCYYGMYFDVDFTVNNRLIFTSFACEVGLPVYADISNNLIVIPFQSIVDSVHNMGFQGAGYINDTLIYIEYTRTTDTLTSYWNATFDKQL